MAIALDDISKASEIFFNLLEKGELREKENKELFLIYMNNNVVKEILETQADKCDSKIITMPDKIYLIPNETNKVLGFDFRKDTIFAKDEKHFYLGTLIMTIIFAEFTNELRPASYIQVIDILSLVRESLERSSTKEETLEIDKEHSLNITKCKELWESKIPWDEGDKLTFKSSKFDHQIGFIRRVIRFLKDQSLITYWNEEDIIKPTQRFSELMNSYFLDQDRKEEIEKIILNGDDIDGIF